MKISSNTKYNNPSYTIDSYKKGDKVSLVSIDEAIERAERTRDLKISIEDYHALGEAIYVSVFDKDTNRILRKDELTTCDRYETFFKKYHTGSGHTLKVNMIDSTDRVMPCMVKSGTGMRLWLHPVFLNKV